MAHSPFHMPEKPRILHLVSWFPSPAHATLGNFIERQLEAFSTSHSAMVLHAAPFGKWDIHRRKSSSLLIYTILFRNRIPLLSALMAYRKGLRCIKREQDYAPSLLHVHVVWPAGIFAYLSGLPYVVTEHFTGYHRHGPTAMSGLKRFISKSILNRASHIFPVSQHLGEAIRSIGVHTACTKISNAVNTDTFYYVPPPSTHQSFVIFHISSLSEKAKNISGLLQAFALAARREPRLHLKIGGDGDSEYLQKLVDQLGIEPNRIETFGESSPTQVAHAMRLSHALLLFSRIENQPVVMLESLCCGRPVLSTDVGGIAEEINPENGILVPPEDVEGMATALLQLVENYSNYHGEAIAQEAGKNYSFQAVGQAYRQAILQLAHALKGH